MKRKRKAGQRIPGIVAASLAASMLMVMVSTIVSAAGMDSQDGIPVQDEPMIEEVSLPQPDDAAIGTGTDAEKALATGNPAVGESPEEAAPGIPAAHETADPETTAEDLAGNRTVAEETVMDYAEAIPEEAEETMPEEVVDAPEEAVPENDAVEASETAPEDAVPSDGELTVAEAEPPTEETMGTEENGIPKPPSKGWKISGDEMEYDDTDSDTDARLMAETNPPPKTGVIEFAEEGASIHPKVNISDITGEIAEPPQITSKASALATEKQWYEYIYYSDQPVGRCQANNNTRISFYDPYDYADALVMEVDDSLTEWSSSNSLQISYTTGSSVTTTSEKSVQTTTSVEVADGADTSTSTGGDSTVTTTVEGRVKTYNKSKQDAYEDNSFNWGFDERVKTSLETEAGSTTEVGVSEEIGVEAGFEAGIEGGIVDKVTGNASSKTTMDAREIINVSLKTGLETEIGSSQNWTTDSHGEVITTDEGYTEDNTTTTSHTVSDDTRVTTIIADRITSAVGSSNSTSVAMSTNNSLTITKTYDAGYFNSSGAPLQWKIIKYTVMMPMMYQVEYLVDGEWIYSDTGYCLLTTIQGTCRAWLENNTAYYEHWGTGEKVTWDEFWSQFFTKDELIAAYQNRLYPDR